MSRRVRKALLIGINYTGTDHALQGCINDVHNMRDFLVQEQGFHPADMVMLTDDQDKHGVFYPTGHNMYVGRSFRQLFYNVKM